MTWRAEDTEILRIIAGSTLHGLHLEDTDDRDELGITIEPPEFVIGLGHFEQSVFRTKPEGVRSGPGDVDRVIYSLRKWARLAVNGNPTILLPLFAPRAMILKGTPTGLVLRAERSMFVTKEAGNRFLGYLNSQRKRMFGELGGAPKRPELIDRYGYDTKFAMHSIRLALQGVELMEAGGLTLPMPMGQQAWCMEVRLGRYTQEQVLAQVDALERKLIMAIEHSKLPKVADTARVNRFLVEAYHEEWYTPEGLRR